MNKKSLISLLLLALPLTSYGISIKAMFQEGDYEGVLEYINSSKENISTQEKSYLAGVSAFRIHDYDQAIAYFKKIEKRTKSYPDLYYLIAQAYYAKSDHKRAASYFEKSIRLKYKPDASLYYLGIIHKELGLYKAAKEYFDQIHEVSFPDLSFIQAAHHQKGLLYLDGYVKTKKLSRKVIKERVLPLFKRAIKSAPKLPLAKVIEGDIKYIKRKFLQEGDEQPLNIRFDQFFNYNSNVIYQSAEPTELNNKSSGLSDSVLDIDYNLDIGTDWGLQNRFNFSLGHQYHLEQEDPNIVRYDGYSLGFQSQFRVNRPYGPKYYPLWVTFGYRYQNMNNQLSGELVFDNRSHFFALGNQFKLFSLNPSFEVRYTELTNFNEQNNQTNYSLALNLPLSFNQYLIFFLSSEIKISNFENLSELSNNQLTNSLTHIIQFNKSHKLTTRGVLGLTDTKEMSETRGTEILISGQILYQHRINNLLNCGINYKYEKKLSKDKATFAYEQHIAGFSLGVTYE